MKRVNYAGKYYGKLYVLRYAGERKKYQHFWVMLCECGKIIERSSKDIARGTAKCECFMKAKPTGEDSRSPTYRTYEAMKRRCLNKNDKKYYRYGGRGITICQEWLDSYKAFHRDMGSRPEGKTIDRIDNDGNYCPENCRWATPQQQAGNTSLAKLYTINGVTKTQADWAKDCGISPPSMTNRLKRGWSKERAFTTPKSLARN